jgi:glycosyltransferase involved in cell wall biosynthesis
MLAENLRMALRKAGHEAIITAIPFKWYPPERILDHMLACRLLDLTESNGMRIDRLIGLKFPAYLIPHPNKVMWVLHQYRAAYDLWDHPLGDIVKTPDGRQIRECIGRADRDVFSTARDVYAISKNVCERLRKYCDVDAHPLYHPPPGAHRFFCARQQDAYFFFPSRLAELKRQRLVVEALGHTRHPVEVYFSGPPENPVYADTLQHEAENTGVAARAHWLGAVPEDKKVELYAHCLGVVYPPLDEDYGYVTLEAMLSCKPVITCTDSGGANEFISHRENGLVVPPEPQALAMAMDELWENRNIAKRWGERTRDRYRALQIAWPQVIDRLLS